MTMVATRTGKVTVVTLAAAAVKTTTAQAADLDSEDEEPLATQKPETYESDEPEGEQDDEQEDKEPEKNSKQVSQNKKEMDDPPADDDDDDDSTVDPDALAPANKPKEPASKRSMLMYKFSQPASAETLQNIQDLVDYWVHRILYEPKESQQHYASLKYVYNLIFNGANVNFGRLHCRMVMAELVVKVCNEPMLTWDRDMWTDGVYEELISITRKLMRKDATTVAKFGEDMEDLEDESVDPAKPVDELKPRIAKMLTLIKLHTALAPIRPTLEDAIDKQKQPKITSETLKDVFSKYLQQIKFNDARYLELLGEMFHYEESGSSDDSESVGDVWVLSDIGGIAKVLRENNAFRFQYLKDKVVHILRSLDRAVYGEESSILIAKKYRYTPPALSREKKRQQEEAQLAVLDQGRKKLKDNGEDPLAAALDKSKLAQRLQAPIADDEEQPDSEDSTMPSLVKPRANKTKPALLTDDDRLDLMEDDESSENGSEKSTVRQILLPSPNLQRTRGMIRKQTYEADEGIFDENGLVKTRRAWTASEDLVLRRGVADFGVGQWKKIKDYYPDVLHNRQTVQIKDRYRTLKNRGEI